jgi:hypothetical protein
VHVYTFKVLYVCLYCMYVVWTSDFCMESSSFDGIFQFWPCQPCCMYASPLPRQEETCITKEEANVCMFACKYVSSRVLDESFHLHLIKLWDGGF